jgi:hypothetical protein
MYLFSEINLINILLLLALWTLGGWLMTLRSFDLPSHERGLVGLGLGLVIGSWLANLLVRWMPASPAFWGAALLTVALGAIMSWPLRVNMPGWNAETLKNLLFSTRTWFFFAAAVILFTLVGRGLGFFDDHQNLSVVSVMATGDIPPHFAFNPELRYGYHYFLLLVAAQFVRLAGAGPWMALDLARGLTLALTLTYGGFVARRISGSKLVATASMVFLAFAGGARWLFLLLPISLQRQLSSSIHLIGSGADTGPNLITAIYKYWAIEGLPALPFPFLHGSGLDPSFSMFHNGWGTSAITIALLLMLLAGKRVTKHAYIPIAILLASLALANEVTFAFLYVGLAFAALSWVIQKRSLRLPRSLWTWVGVMFVGGVLALLQGGMFTEIASGWFQKQAASGGDTYFRVSFTLGLPSLLSAHIGSLSLLNPLQWVAILGETGLAVFALPIVLKQLPGFSREENWLEAAWIGSIIISLLMVFVQYTGNAGPTAVSRMQAHFLSVVKIYAVPLLWVWARQRSESFQIGVFAWGLASIFSGLTLFSLQMTAIPNPVYSIYLTQLDAQIFTRQWDRLAPHTMAFDPSYPRAVTILGRPIRSSITIGANLPEWIALEQHPDPYDLKAAGYDYLYVHMKYLTKYEDVIRQGCEKLLDQAEDKNKGKLVDARYLFDISGCVR